MVVIGGFFMSWQTTSVTEKDTVSLTKPLHRNPVEKTLDASVTQSTQGGQSPAINSGKDVQINYGGETTGRKKTNDKADTGAAEQQAVPVQVKQITQGEKSPAINTKATWI